MKFTVAILQRGKMMHADCFEDFARALAEALRRCGHQVTDFDDPGRIIAFGANNLRDTIGGLKKDTIIFNAEQLTATEPGFQMRNYEQWREFTIWDYAESNIAPLRSLGIQSAVLCPLGYVPTMETIATAENQDIDVLFYGAINARRRTILRALSTAGLNVVRLFGVYGVDRDAAIARAKVVLNIHFYDNPIFEIFRVSHLLANRVCVVSEDGGVDEGLETFARSATIYAARDRIVEACQEAVADAAKRKAAVERGYETFRAIDLVENVRRAVAESGQPT